MLILVVCVVFVAMCALVYLLFNGNITFIRQEKPLRKLEVGDYLYEVIQHNDNNPIINREKISKVDYSIVNGKVVKVFFYLFGKRLPSEWDVEDEYCTCDGYISSYKEAKKHYNKMMGDKYMTEFKKKVEIGARSRIINDFKNGSNSNI